MYDSYRIKCLDLKKPFEEALLIHLDLIIHKHSEQYQSQDRIIEVQTGSNPNKIVIILE